MSTNIIDTLHDMLSSNHNENTGSNKPSALPTFRLPIKRARKRPAPKLHVLSESSNTCSTALPIITDGNTDIVSKDDKEENAKNCLKLNLTDISEPSYSIPSAATTMTATSFSTLQEDNYDSSSVLLISSFNNKLKLSENDGSSISEPSFTTPTSCIDPEIINKSIEKLNEHDWKILSENNFIETLEVLGEGNGGSVQKCQLRSVHQEIFALKIITTDPTPEFQKQMVRELNYNKTFNSPYIVKYYGTFLNEASASIHICMEYMGGRSLDAVYKSFKERDGRLGEKPLGKVAEGVLKGLAYLNEHKVMHRDIKPQNILLDSKGNVKLCDFGVSGDVVNSLAMTFTGTSFYMAPERIKNEPYTISCDVWSLGLTLLEGAMGMFPFVKESSPDLQIAPLDLLMIILEFEPILEDEPSEGITWSSGFKDFIKVCLTKEGKKRPSPRQMLEHPWMIKQLGKSVRMDKLVEYCWSQS